MKIRKGYVSNSSSASFIISADDYETVFDVAEAMINLRDWCESDVEDIEKLNSLKISRDTNISFQTCNYDTYIVKENGYYLINTCNNHPFYDLFNYIRNNAEIETLYEKYDEELGDLPSLNKFYRLENGIVGHEHENYNDTFYCCEQAWVVNNGYKDFDICPVCLKDKNKTMDSYKQYNIVENRRKKVKRIIEPSKNQK